jgi:hypothetical protein
MSGKITAIDVYAACKTCVFFSGYNVPEQTSGNCHRYPPSLTDENSGGPWQPYVTHDEWCGEHRPGGQDQTRRFMIGRDKPDGWKQ